MKNKKDIIEAIWGGILIIVLCMLLFCYNKVTSLISWIFLTIYWIRRITLIIIQMREQKPKNSPYIYLCEFCKCQYNSEKRVKRNKIKICPYCKMAIEEVSMEMRERSIS